MDGNEKRASLVGEQNKWCLPSSWTFVSWRSIFYNCDIKSNANWAEVRACLLIATTWTVKLIFKIHKMILKVVFSYLPFNLKLHIRMIHVNYFQMAHCGEWILKKYFTDKMFVKFTRIEKCMFSYIHELMPITLSPTPLVPLDTSWNSDAHTSIHTSSYSLSLRFHFSPLCCQVYGWHSHRWVICGLKNCMCVGFIPDTIPSTHVCAQILILKPTQCDFMPHKP